MIKKIDHIGVAVKDLNAAIKFYEGLLGLKVVDTEIVEDQKVKVAFLPVGDSEVELLESTAPDGPIAKFIEKNGEGIQHIAFRVENLTEKLAELKEKGVRLIDEKPRRGAGGAMIAFLHPKSTFGTLVELCKRGVGERRKVMSMLEKLEQLNKLRAQIIAGGGPKRIEKQHEASKKTARERIELLCDPGSFIEINVFAGDSSTEKIDYPGEGVVTGHGTIDGRLVYIFAQDFTVTGGSLGRIHADKICEVLDLAMKTGAPVIGLNDSGGARIQEGVDALNGYGKIFFRNTIASGVIPQISVIMGPSAGGAVYSPALMDFIFMVQHTSHMFITGPAVIKSVTGEEVSMEDLGGALTHNQTSGVAHFIAEDEDTCLNMIRQLISYLPANNLEEPPLAPPREPAGDPEELLTIIPDDPNRSYDVKRIISLIFDGGELLEVHPYYARNGVIGFARINGQVVGIIANQPNHLAGCLDINVSDKISRFIRFCDCFNIPLVTFMDVPGFLPGTDQEYGGIIRHGAKMLYAYSEATVPKITIILRKAYGGAYLAMCAKALGADSSYAWPTAEIAVMGPGGAVNIVNREQIAKAENPAAMRAQLVAEYREKFANPYIAAARPFLEDVIDPRDTRKKIIMSLRALANKREGRPRKKHGNFPV